MRKDIDLVLKQQLAQRDGMLVSAAKSGSSTAFAELRQLYSEPLYKSIVRITKNKEDAEDALQDTFLRAYLSLPYFEGRSQVSTWLTRIAINSALMILRRRRTRPEGFADYPSESGDDFRHFEIRDSAPNPEQIYDQRQRCTLVLRAIEGLDPILRTPLESQLARGLSIKEIAEALRISEAAAKARLHRARIRLGTRLLGTRAKNGKLQPLPRARNYQPRPDQGAAMQAYANG